MKKVLIAENYPPVRELLSLVVGQLLHCEYDISENFNSAFENIQQKNYDLILLDMSIQNFFSRCLIKSCRQNHLDTAIVIMVDNGDDFTAKAGLNSGADKCLYKPFSIRELLETVSPILISPALGQDSRFDNIRKFLTNTNEQFIQQSMIE